MEIRAHDKVTGPSISGEQPWKTISALIMRASCSSAGRLLQKPDQLIKLGPLLFRIAALDCRLDTMGRVVFKDKLLDTENCGPNRGRLRKDVHAIAVSFDHALHPTDLAFNARQPIDGFLFIGFQATDSRQICDQRANFLVTYPT
jgi:hypothetical protein